jgi:hypothetical protein
MLSVESVEHNVTVLLCLEVKLVEALCYKPEGRGLSTDEVIDSFSPNLPNPSRRTMALESTQPITEISTRRSFWE